MKPGTDSAFATPGLYRLLTWLSPGFPIGAYSYSHGLEAAVEAGAVSNDASLQGWINANLTSGTGRVDADTLREAHRAAVACDLKTLIDANQRGVAFRATTETRLETTAQGEAFLATCCIAWPEPFLTGWAAELANTGAAVCYPAAVGAAMARARIPFDSALTGYLHAMAANLVSAGLRLGIVGQTGGQCILARLEPAIAIAVGHALDRFADRFGSATFAVELASTAHETQYTRLFRS
jgi:urease accessory protein